MANTVESGFWSMLGLLALGAAPLVMVFLSFKPGKYQPPREDGPPASREALFESDLEEAPPPEPEPPMTPEEEALVRRLNWWTYGFYYPLYVLSFIFYVFFDKITQCIGLCSIVRGL